MLTWSGLAAHQPKPRSRHNMAAMETAKVSFHGVFLRMDFTPVTHMPRPFAPPAPTASPILLVKRTPARTSQFVPAERWQSGRMHRTRNAAYLQGYRGFESHPLRHGELSRLNFRVKPPVECLSTGAGEMSYLAGHAQYQRSLTATFFEAPSKDLGSTATSSPG